MKRLIAAVFLCTSMQAAPQVIAVGDQGWSITVDGSLPEPLKISSRSKGEVSFRGRAGRYGINGYIEKPAATGKTHEDAYRYYWSQAQQTLRIERGSVHVTRTERFCRVEFTTRAPVINMAQRNVFYYFAYGNRWGDIELTFLDPRPSDDQVITVFEEKLSYGTEDRPMSR